MPYRQARKWNDLVIWCSMQQVTAAFPIIVLIVVHSDGVLRTSPVGVVGNTLGDFKATTERMPSASLALVVHRCEPSQARFRLCFGKFFTRHHKTLQRCRSNTPPPLTIQCHQLELYPV